MRLVYAGTPEVALPSLQALLDSTHDVVAVVTRPDAASGRGRTLSMSPVKSLALAAGLPVLQPAHPRDETFQAELKELAPEAIPVVAYGALVPTAALQIPRHGWINLHFSLLPAWRGAAPVQRALLAGDEITGATTFRLDEGMDTGPVFGMLTETVRPADTTGDLLTRLAEAGSTLLVATLDALETGTLQAVDQSTEGVSIAPKVSVEELRVSWSAPAQHIDRLIRAAAPAPGAWTVFRDQRLKLGPVTLATDIVGLAPGELGADRVGTGSGEVVLGQIKAQGKGWMDVKAWANGARPVAGERFA